jgi:hypothetical protein
MPDPAGTSGRRRPGAHVRARHATLFGGLLCSLFAWLAAGGGGLATGLLATLLVVAFLWSGAVPLQITRGLESRAGIGLAVLLLTYTLRLALVLLVLRLARRAEFLDGRWLGVTVIICALTWTAVHVVVAVREGKVHSGAP